MTTPFSFKRHVLPHVLAVLALLLLTVAYFSPLFFDNKTLVQGDVLQFQGAAREITQWREQTGHQPLWTNSMFSGMPAYLIQAYYPGDWSQYLVSLFTVGLPTAAGNLFCALLCGYLLFIALGVRWWLAIGGAVALAFSSYNLIILVAGHNTKSFALAYAPLVIGGVLVAFRKNRWLGAALLALGLTMNVRSNHLQITFYLALLLGIFFVVELIGAIREKRLTSFLGTTALLGAAALLAVGVSFGRLYTTATYSKYSIRGKSELTTPAPSASPQAAAEEAPQGTGLDRTYAFAWSYGVAETFTLLVPDFYGGSSTHELGANSATAVKLREMGVPEEQLTQYLQSLPVYWGDVAFTSGPVYVGAVVCFLFILGLFLVERRTALWLLLATLLGIVLAWGRNFPAINNFLFDHFPGYNKFRAVSMALVIPQLAMPVLAVLAAWQVLRPRPVVLAGAGPVLTDEPPRERALLRALYVTGGLLALAFLVGLMSDMTAAADAGLAKQGFPIAALREDRAALVRGDVFRSLIFVGLAFAVLYFYLKNKLSATMAGLALSALVLVDLWSVDKRYVNETHFKENVAQENFLPTPADQQILQDKDLSYRVLNLQNPFNDARTSYFHKSIGGYHGAKMRRYQDLMDRQIAQNNTRALDMLNTRYIMAADPRQPVQRNPNALGNAWLVREVKLVSSPDAEMAALTDLQPGQTAVVDASKFPDVKAGQLDPTGSSISLTSYAPDKLTYSARLPATGVAVFSEIYYADGWNAYLDGKAVPHFRANYVLRAMRVPAGQHQIEFRFEPKEYAIGNTVSLISSVLLILSLAAAAWYGWRRLRAPEVVAARVPVAS